MANNKEILNINVTGTKITIKMCGNSDQEISRNIDALVTAVNELCKTQKNPTELKEAICKELMSRD